MSYRREIRHVHLIHPDGTREYSVLFLNPGETVEECLKRNGLEGVEVEEVVQVFPETQELYKNAAESAELYKNVGKNR